MVKITETLLRKRAEHNNLEISTLEEVSLHQQDVERIEHIDKWCRDLKILYLQSNLIPRIENVGRLKKLEYLNLALNNIERIENLEGCESLQKLDLTVNFIGELTSIQCLQGLIHFQELFLTGNPCTEYDGYRDYVIATLPKLKRLDGTEVEKSGRIRALQRLEELTSTILEQQEEYRGKRERERKEAEVTTESRKEKEKGSRWYTDMNPSSETDVADDEKHLEQGSSSKEDNEKFWKEKVAYTPESRIAVHEHMQKQKNKDKKDDSKSRPREVRLKTDDGRILNVNQAKMDFSLRDDEDENRFVLEVGCYKHLDTELIDVDVQPMHVKVVIKGKILQLVLAEEVRPDSSIAKRSQTTGHLLVTMPKVKEIITCKKSHLPDSVRRGESEKAKEKNGSQRTFLEVEPSKNNDVDLMIVDKAKPRPPEMKQPIREKPVSDEFVDDPDVPPLV